MRKFYLWGSVVIFTSGIIFLFVYSSQKEKTTDQEYYSAFARNYKIFSPALPESSSFAGEEANLNNILIRENLDREVLINTYWHTNTILSIKRANRWFPVIVPILKENNIPEDFKYLALIESGLMNVVSPKGATGFWQFIEETGKIYGLEINKEVDERYNVEKSTVAACRYLNDSYAQFQNWTLVAAAFNAGKRRISETIGKQKNNSYYELLFNEETSRYVYRILAMKIIYESPAHYGYYLRQADLYPTIAVREVTQATTITDLVAYAGENGISYKTLKDFNPWMRSDHLPNSSGKKYLIKIPEDTLLQYNEIIQKVEDEGEIFNDTITVNELY